MKKTQFFFFSLFCLKAATSASSLLTGGVVIQQEGIDEVLVDVLTVPQISMHLMHVFAECCHTAHIEKEKKEITFHTPYSVRKKKKLPLSSNLWTHMVW